MKYLTVYTWIFVMHAASMYSAGQKKRYKYCFMKQKCQLQMGIAQYENAATPLKTRGIDTTHFQMRYITLFQVKRLKSYQPSNFEYVVSIVKQTLHFYFS